MHFSDSWRQKFFARLPKKRKRKKYRIALERLETNWMKAHLLGTGIRLCFHALSFSIVCVLPSLLFCLKIDREVVRGGNNARPFDVDRILRSETVGRDSSRGNERRSSSCMYDTLLLSTSQPDPRRVIDSNRSLKLPTGHPTSRFDRLFAHASLALLAVHTRSTSPFRHVFHCFISSFLFSFFFCSRQNFSIVLSMIFFFFYIYIKYNFCSTFVIIIVRFRHSTRIVRTTAKWTFTNVFLRRIRDWGTKVREKGGFRAADTVGRLVSTRLNEQKEYSAREHRSSTRRRHAIRSAQRPLRYSARS